MPVSYIHHRIYSQIYNLSTIVKYICKLNYFNYSKIKLIHDIHPNPGPKYNLSIGYTNIRSLFSDTDNTLLIEVQDCKFNDLIKEFVYINDCDIIFLTETWLKDIEINKYQMHIQGYRDPLYRNRLTLGGGLLIYYKENYKTEIINSLINQFRKSSY